MMRLQEASEEIIRQLGNDQAVLTVIFVAPQYKDFYDKIPDLLIGTSSPVRCLVVLAAALLEMGGSRTTGRIQITCANCPE
ncbi:MAG: hypothetical protein Ct9H300mP23_03200 [Nitrospinota bacterium]|nr:MAG: hypothetical protein Ct9H300mP23_03200 [Nitrospinota bacterium]